MKKEKREWIKKSFKLFLILEGVLIPLVLLFAFIVSLVKGESIRDNINTFYYAAGIIVMITAIPSLYRRPYSQKGMYRKVLNEMFGMKKTGYEDTYVENKQDDTEDPFVTGMFIVLVGVVLLLVGFFVERIFNII